MMASDFRYMRTKDLQVNQTNLAQRLGVSRETISNLERSYEIPLVYALAIQHLVWKERVQPVLAELL